MSRLLSVSAATRPAIVENTIRSPLGESACTVYEPGAVETELTDHIRDGVREAVRERFRGLERMSADDIADAIEYIVTRPRHVAINEILIRPTEQAW